MRSNFFGLMGKSSKNSSAKRNSGSRPLRFEQMESRQLLAGGLVPVPIPISAPTVQVVNQAVPVLDILPGANDKMLFEMTLKANRLARFDEMMIVPVGDALLSQNTTTLTLRADMDSNKMTGPNGCETVLSTARADWQTDVVDFNVIRPVWVSSSRGLRVEVVADFSTYLAGNAIGVDVWAGFRDLRNRPVPDSNVTYLGVPPVLHTLESSVFGVSQSTMVLYQDAMAGDADVELFSFWARTNNAIPKSVSFVANKGSLANCENYSLWADHNWDGAFDGVYNGTVSGEKLTFALDEFVSGGMIEIHASASKTLAQDPHLQLAFLSQPSGMSAINAETGKPLKGFILNGSGEGQNQMYSQPELATYFTFVKDADLVVKEFVPDSYYATALSGTKDVVLDVFSAYDPNSVTITNVVISAQQGNLENCVNYVLWLYDFNGSTGVKVADGELAWAGKTRVVIFSDIAESQTAGQSVRYEVHADVLDTLANGYGGVRTQLLGHNGITATSNGKDVTKLVRSALQTYWSFYEPITIDALSVQIASLQAQLQCPQNGGGLG